MPPPSPLFCHSKRLIVGGTERERLQNVCEEKERNAQLNRSDKNMIIIIIPITLVIIITIIIPIPIIIIICFETIKICTSEILEILALVVFYLKRLLLQKRPESY